MKKNAFALSAIGATAVFGLAYFGHHNSDAQALSQLTQKQELDDAYGIFMWRTTHYNQAKASDPVHPGKSSPACWNGQVEGCGAIKGTL